MRIKKRVLRKMISVFASVLLLINSFTPYLLIAPSFINQVKAEDPTVTQTQEPTPTDVISPTSTVEPTLAPTETVTPVPTVEVTPTIEETPVETVTPTEIPTLAPTEAPSVPSPPVEEDPIIESEGSAKLAIPLWQTNSDGSEITTAVVSLNQTYIAPQNDKVTVTFTKLPDNPGKLTIKEVKLSAEQMEEIGAFSDTAYDITSTMEDGSFEYSLTLPNPNPQQNIEVKFSEDGQNFNTLGGVTAQNDTLTIIGLNHFTIFVIAGTITDPAPDTYVGEPFDETLSSVIINEFLFDPSTGNEWIELFNKTASDIDLSNWTITDDGGDSRSLSGNLPANGIFVYENTGEDFLNDTINDGEGDVIYLKDNDTIVDKVTYQQQADGTVINDTSEIATIDAGQSVSRTDDGGTSWETGTSTKGWFNDAGEPEKAPLLSDIDDALSADGGIDSNIGELDNPSATPTEESDALYFEKRTDIDDPDTAVGKIVFTASLNLSNQDTVGILQDLGTAMDMSDGHIEFNSDTAQAMTDTGAIIYMYGLDDLGYTSTPDIIVKDDDGNILGTNDPADVSGINYDPDTGVLSFTAEHFTVFDLGPVSDITFPEDEVTYTEDSWNEVGEIQGTADSPSSGVASVWISIQRDFDGAWWEGEDSPLCFEDSDEICNQADFDEELGTWFYLFDFIEPDGKEGYTVRSHALDNAGNLEATNEVHFYFTNDVTGPNTPVADPIADDYTSDQSVSLSSSDETSGLATIYYTTDESDPAISETRVSYPLDDSEPIDVNQDMTIKAIAYDNAGNSSSILTAEYGIAPVISSETSTLVGTTSTTITWTTDDLSTSRVIYDTVSHPVLGAAPNYDYANSTVEDSTKVTSHSVGVTGLTAGTTYYYRTISHGSPETVGAENSFKTDTSVGGGGGAVLGAATAPVCNDTKPGSAPFGLTAVAGVNSVTLTWNKASDPVSYYLVTYGTSSGSQTYGNPNVGDSSTTSYTITNLSGSATYYFKVRAGNGCAPGDFSNEASATPSGGFVAGVAPGFEAGVLGEATKSAELMEELVGEPTPTTTVINAGLVKGIQSIAKNKSFKYILPIILIILLGALSFYFYKKRNS